MANERKVLQTQFNYDPANPDHIHKNSGEVLAIPDQALSPAQLLQMHHDGTTLSSVGAYYENLPDFVERPDFEKLNKLDLIEYAKYNQRKISALQAEYQRAVEEEAKRKDLEAPSEAPPEAPPEPSTEPGPGPLTT